MDVPLSSQNTPIIPRITKSFHAVYNMLAGPPMTEQERTSRAIKEAYIMKKNGLLQYVISQRNQLIRHITKKLDVHNKRRVFQLYSKHDSFYLKAIWNAVLNNYNKLKYPGSHSLPNQITTTPNPTNYRQTAPIPPECSHVDYHISMTFINTNTSDRKHCVLGTIP